MAGKAFNLKKNRWIHPAAGAVIGLLLALLLFKRTYCFTVYQPGGSFITAGLGIVSAAIGLLVRFPPAPWKKLLELRAWKRAVYLACALFFTAALVALVSPLFHQYDRNTCTPDFDKLVALTARESTAVVTKNMDIIRDIYTPDAVVTQVNANQSWAAYTYYSQVFAQWDHCTNSQSQFQVTAASPFEVTLTTASQGSYGPAGQGCTSVFDNPAGSNQWVFRKVNGQWKIVNFEFNRPVK